LRLRRSAFMSEYFTNQQNEEGEMSKLLSNFTTLKKVGKQRK
jgi:hypothetical protein